MPITGVKPSEFDQTTITAMRSKLGLGTVNVTYSQLVTLIGTSALVPGTLYRITDYATVHWMVGNDGTNGWYYILDDAAKVINSGDTEVLLVVATSTSTLAFNAFSETHPEDIIRYDPLITNHMDVPFFYDSDASSTITGFKGLITYREDTINDLKADYDWRVLKYRMYSIEQTSWVAQAYSYGAKVSYDGNIYKAINEISTDLSVTPDIRIADWEKIMSIPSDLYISFNSTSHFNIGIIDASDFVDKLTFASGCQLLDISNIIFTAIPFIIFGEGVAAIKIGLNCTVMSFGLNCFAMSLGANCNIMTIDAEVANIDFNSNCTGIYIGEACSNMALGVSCSDIKIGKECTKMTFGSNCDSLNIPDSSSYNEFRSGVSDFDYNNSTPVENGTTVIHQLCEEGIVQSYLSSAGEGYIMNYDTDIIGKVIAPH